MNQIRIVKPKLTRPARPQPQPLDTRTPSGPVLQY
jgi:hypothetical protein